MGVTAQVAFNLLMLVDTLQQDLHDLSVQTAR